MNPVDWMAIETSTLSAGAYVLAEANQAVPVNGAARRLWGQPVVTTVGQAPGTGWFVNSDAVELRTDQGVEVRWAETGDDFQRNQIRCRVEGRFDLVVSRPNGVVRFALTA